MSVQNDLLSLACHVCWPLPGMGAEHLTHRQEREGRDRSHSRKEAGRGSFLGSSTELQWDVQLEKTSALFETAWEMAS